MKIPKRVLTYFKEKWDKENRKKILNSFRVKRDFKETTYNDLFLETKRYQKKISVYDKQNSLFQEFNQIQLDSENWYDILSYSAKTYIKELCEKWDKEKNTRINYELTPRQISYLDNRLFELQELFKSDEDYFCFLRKDMKLRNSAIRQFIYDRRPLYKPAILLKRVKLFAIEEKKNWFNKKGNLLPKIIKGFLSGEMKLPLTKKEKIRRSMNTTYITFKSLAYSNAEFFKYFITLTFAEPKEKKKHLENNERSKSYNEYDIKFTYVENPKDYDLCVKKLHAFFVRLNKKMKEQNIDFKYLGVPEYQKNGNIHYHFLFSKIPEEFLYEVPSWLDFDNEKNQRRYDKGLRLWVYGKSTVEEIFSKERVSTYLSKYLLKSLKEIEETEYEERLNKRRFYYSKNLIKPKINYENYYEDFDSKENVKIVSSISRSNLNPYNQSQTILYQLKKLDNETEIKIQNEDFIFDEEWL